MMRKFSAKVGPTRKIYISGKMTGLQDLGIEKFYAVEKELVGCGHFCANPARNSISALGWGSNLKETWIRTLRVSSNGPEVWGDDRELVFTRYIKLDLVINYYPAGIAQELMNLHIDHMTWVKSDLKLLMDCDTIYLLKGWEESKGANIEKAIAEMVGIEVKYEGDEL